MIELLRKLETFTIAESLGGFESLVCVPAEMTHAAMTPEARETAGISDRLVRFSIGLEHTDDLVRDIFSALEQAAVTSADKVAYLPNKAASKCA